MRWNGRTERRSEPASTTNVSSRSHGPGPGRRRASRRETPAPSCTDGGRRRSGTAPRPAIADRHVSGDRPAAMGHPLLVDELGFGRATTSRRPAGRRARGTGRPRCRRRRRGGCAWLGAAAGDPRPVPPWSARGAGRRRPSPRAPWRRRHRGPARRRSTTHLVRVERGRRPDEDALRRPTDVGALPPARSGTRRRRPSPGRPARC